MHKVRHHHLPLHFLDLLAWGHVFASEKMLANRFIHIGCYEVLGSFLVTLSGYDDDTL